MLTTPVKIALWVRLEPKLFFFTMNYRELAATLRRIFGWQRRRNSKRCVQKLRNGPIPAGNAQRLRRGRPQGLMNAAEVVVGNV